MISTPKINLLYYKHLVDRAIERFAIDFEKDFIKSCDTYILSKNCTKKYEKKLREYIVEDIFSFTKEFYVLKPNYYFIIGSCYPRDNALLNYVKNKDSNEYFKGTVKYILTEDDIRIDDEKFNSMFDRIFESIMTSKKLGDRSKNVFLIKNPKSDCYVTYRTIKDVYGKTNIVNLKKINDEKFKSNFRSVNDMIDAEVTGIKNIIRSEEFKPIRKEIEQFVKFSMTGEI